MPTAKELREKRAPLAAEIRRQADRINAETPPRDFTSEEKPAWEKVNDDYNALTRQIELAERVEQVEAEQAARVGDPRLAQLPLMTPPPAGNDGGSTAITEAHRRLAFAAWHRGGRGVAPSQEQSAACRLLGVNPFAGELSSSLPSTAYVEQLQAVYQNNPDKFRQRQLAEVSAPDYQAALSGITGTAGGYLFPSSFVRELEINMLAFGGILQAAEIMRTSSGERIAWPTADDTSNKGRRLNENAAVNLTPDPTFGQVYWDAYDYTSDAVLVPFRLMMDAIFDLPTILGRMLGERLGRKIALDCTTGTGANQPKGIITCATTGVTTASATAIAFDEVLDLIFSIDPAYRAGARFMFHDKITQYLRKLKDGIGRYLWEPSSEPNVPDMLWGYPCTISMEMDSTVAATKNVILFGQLSKYKVRQVAEVRTYRLQERYRDNDQDGFLAFIRADGNLLDAGTHPIKLMVMHA